MYISEEHRIIYLAHPRTASNATARAFRSALGLNGKVNKDTHHVGLTQEINGDWIVMTTVRNHYDTFVSWYYSQWTKRSQPFGTTYIKKLIGHDGIRIKPSRYFRGNRLWALHGVYATHIMRYETLQQDFDTILALRDISPTTIPPVNVGHNRAKRAYQKVFDPESRAFVASLFGAEMRELGYAW